MNSTKVIDFLIDTAPFIMYLALLVKIHFSWREGKERFDEVRRHRIAAVLVMAAVVIAIFLASNAYALLIYGKTFLSLRFFQMFIVGNCVVYWMLIDFILKEPVPTQGRLRESAD